MKKLVLTLLVTTAVGQFAQAHSVSSNGGSSEDSAASSLDGLCQSSNSDCSRDVLLKSDVIIQAALNGQITPEEAAELLAEGAEALRKSKR